jgi:hypothetical protein
MARRRLLAATNFSVLDPDDTVVTLVDPSTRLTQIRVQVTPQGVINHVNAFTTTIFDISGAGPVQIGLPTPLVLIDSVNLIYARDMDMGTSLPTVAPANSNRRAFLVASSNLVIVETQNYDFRAMLGGSGSGSSEALKIQAACEFCRDDEPVPVLVHLHLEQCIVLAHPQDRGHDCSWLSAPTDVDGRVGFWLLRKTDARTWNLALQVGKDEIVAYRAKTKADRECVFPTSLERTSGSAPVSWPKTVKVTQSP